MNIGFVTIICSCFLLCCWIARYLSSWPGLLPVLQHPLAHTLRLSVLACAWSVLGSVGFAYQFGYSFLSYFIGMAAAFMLTPLMLLPLQRLSELYQLRSLADFFAYRYDHNLAGLLVTLTITLSAIPLLALQIQALQQTMSYLLEALPISSINSPFNTSIDTSFNSPANLVADTLSALRATALVPSDNAEWLSGLFWLLMILCIFPYLYQPNQNQSNHHQHPSRNLSEHQNWNLDTLLTLLGSMKLMSMVVIAILATQIAFGSYAGLSQWLQQQPQALSILHGSTASGPWRGLMLAFFVAVFAMPHVFEQLFLQHKKSSAWLYQTAWTMPLYLWIFAFCIPFILWAGMKLDVQTSADYFTVGLGLLSSNIILQIAVLWVVLCATTAVFISAPLSCGRLIVNFILLPRYQHWQHPALWQRLRQLQTLSAVGVLLLAALFYRLLNHSRDLSELILLAFIGTLQLLPGIIGIIFWRGANLTGLCVGLSAGLLMWLITLVLPTFAFTDPPLLPMFDLGFTPGIENWQFFGLVAICLNTSFFIIASLLGKQRESEKEATINCSLPQMRRSYRQRLPVNTIDELTSMLNQLFDHKVAAELTHSATRTLELATQHTSPYALRRLREQILMDLTGKIGPLVARRLLDHCLPFVKATTPSRSLDTQLIEQRLDRYQDHFSGLAAELDQLRRLYRETLRQLPVGMVSLSQEGEILSWNNAMESLTGLAAASLLGGDISRLSSPWQQLLSVTPQASGQRTQEVTINQHKRWLQLHWVHFYAQTPPYELMGRMLSIEDITQTKQLEASLTHSERLAAIGRLAAGVAHEIGNPVTAIACLAQELPYQPIDPQDTQAQLKALSLPILQQTQRITHIVEALTHFSYSGEQSALAHEPVDMQAVIIAALQLAALTTRSRQHQIENTCPPDQWIMGNAQRLQQVFLNLINNACDASPKSSPILIDHQPDEQFIILTVRDFGSGIPAELIAQVCQPFVTSKSLGQGTGLGLYLADSIVKEHHGSLQILSPQLNGNPGTEVMIKLPRHQQN